MFPILNAIPAIHATIVGVLVAFFSAFLIFAYQKVTEAQKKLEKALKVAESVSTPTSFAMNGSSSLINENGDLDWDVNCKILINNAKSLFSHLNGVKYGVNLDPLGRNINSNDIVKIVDELTHFFYLFFTSYPMNGKSVVANPQLALKKSSNQLFDYNRYTEIQRRISFLTWVWNTSQESLIHLFNVYDQIKENELKDEKNAQISQIIKNFDSNSALQNETRNIIISQIENSFSLRINHKNLSLLIDFFQRVQTYQAQVMPILDETIIEFETYNNEFKVKKLTKNILRITIYILITGIIIPLILLERINNIPNSNSSFIISYIEYIILIASFSPYFLICFHFLKKIEKTIFR